MDIIARQVCLNAEDAEATLETSRNFPRPVRNFPGYERADQTTGRCILECDVFRRKAEARAVIGGAFPDGSASVSRLQNRALSRVDKSLSLASVHGSLGFPFCAKWRCRSLDPCGGPARQDVPTAADTDVQSVP